MSVIIKLSAYIVLDNTGKKRKLPVLFINGEPFQQMIDYMLEEHVSSSAVEKIIQAVTLLLEYMEVNHDAFESARKLFKGFVLALYDGTVGEDGNDPSGLFWQPRAVNNANRIISVICSFSDYLHRENSEIAPLNPWVKSTNAQERMAWAAWHHKKNNAFMAHTLTYDKGRENSQKSRAIKQKNNTTSDSLNECKHFPEDQLFDLIVNGFVRGKKAKRIFKQISAETHNIRDILILLLMNRGGLRISEPFHLYVTDVLPDPEDKSVAYVRIYHPSEGLAPQSSIDERGRTVRSNRATWLHNKYGLGPRNKLLATDRHFAGWKDLRLDDKISRSVTVQWFPRSSGRLFLKLWEQYLVERANLPAAAVECHPFAFCSKSGLPYSIRSFNKNYAIACKRIGLEASEIFGTNVHGHRHAYGQRLADNGVSPLVIMKCMHHKSLLSQLTYTAPTQEKVKEVLAQAQLELNTKGEPNLKEALRLGGREDKMIENIIMMNELQKVGRR